MKEIAKQIRNCQGCNLCKTATNKVVGRGSAHPKVLFIGEAPGAAEDQEGKPFCGASGKELEKWIAYLGLQPTDYAIINVVKCRPPENRDPTDEEIAACRPFLDEQIRLLNPEFIVTLGRIAATQFTPIESFTKELGFKDDRLFVMVHPAYILRNRGFPVQSTLRPLKDKLGLEEIQKENMVQLDKFVLNRQQADNLGKDEMISPPLAALHYFCKKAKVPFKDIDTNNFADFNGKETYIKEFKQTNEIDLFEEDLVAKLRNTDLYVFYIFEKGNLEFLGWVDKEYVDKLEMSYHYKAQKNCKKIMYDNLRPMHDLLKIYVEKAEEKIEPADYVPLHCHSQYSIGDGYGRPEQIAKEARKKGFQAYAVTDHGTLAGTIYMQEALLEKGIKPILGIEAYVIMEPGNESKYVHATLLAKNEAGWMNLLRLNEIAVRKHFYYRPRMLWKDILEHHEGVILMSACMNGFVSTPLKEGKTDVAKQLVAEAKAAFGEDLYIEIMPNRIPEQIDLNPFLLAVADQAGVKCVVTADIHYPNHEDKKIHDAIKAISRNKPYQGAGFSDDTFYQLTGDEIKQLMEKHHPLIANRLDEFKKNTFEVSEKCHYKIKPPEELDTLPRFEVPNEFTKSAKPQEALLKRLCEEGMKRRGFAGNKTYEDRIALEYERVTRKGYTNYFLVVWDYVRWCKEEADIMVGPGRGSAGSSLLAYCIGITDVDPVKYELLFDRFISDIRKDLPDIDLDFEDSKRDRVPIYLRDKYGERHVQRVITYSTFHGKGAIRDVGRIFGIPIAEVNKISNLVITRSGGDARSDYCLTDTFTEFEQAKEFYKKYEEACQVAIALEGHIRHRGIHAAAVCVTCQPSAEVLPIDKVSGEYVMAWEKKKVEYMNIIKFDILGLKTLSVISDTMRIAGIKELPNNYDDPLVFEKIFIPGRTLGVFQFETTGLSKLSRQMGIKNFKEMYDATTLYRPGPLHSGETANYVLRHLGKKKWDYYHPLLENLTKDTLGLILYQEQVMQVMFELGKFSWATAESARKIMSKSKGKDAFNKMRSEFVINAKRVHNVPEAESEKIFDVVSTFGSYGFNKSHAVEYSVIGYWCAWLKTYYPDAFYTVLLSREESGVQIANYVRDAKAFGVKVTTPHINYSRAGYYMHDKVVYAGFSAINGMGDKSSHKLVAARPAGGYESIKQFIELTKPTKSVFAALAKAGAFDCWGVSRKLCVEAADRLKLKGFDPAALVGEDWNDKDRDLNLMTCVDLPTEKPAIDYFENPFAGKVKFETIQDLTFDGFLPERWIKGIVTFINFKQEGLEGQWTMFDNVLERRYAHLNINDGTGNVLVHLSPEQYTYYKRYLEQGIGFPVVIKGSSIPDLQKIYADAMVVLTDADLKQPIARKVLRPEEHKKAMDDLKAAHPRAEVKTIQNVRYKVSKNKKPYARLAFDDSTDGLVFQLTSQIFVAGEIIAFTCRQKPFIEVKARA